MTEPLSIHHAALECPNDPFLVTTERIVTFAESAARVRAALGWLAEQGVHPGDVAAVAFVAHPDESTVTLILALFELGVPAMPLHPRWSFEERSRALAQGADTPLAARFVDASAVLAGSSHAARLAPSVDPEAILAVIHTSGSSGSPRGVLLSRRAFLASAQASAENLGWRADDRWLLALPLAHVGGFSILVRCLVARRPIVLADPMTDLARTEPTLLSLVPTQLSRLLARGVPCPPSLRAVLLGGAASAPSLLQAARTRGYPVLASYGATEACSQIATQEPGATSSHDVGRPWPHTALRIVGDRIQIRGPTLASGFYPALPLPLTPDGFFELPDRGALDGSGRLTVLGRSDDQIVTGGENVAPLEVEVALLAHPEVTAACVFGEPDPDFGERVCALLVTTTGGAPRGLRNHLAPLLGAFKWPKAVAVCPELPLLPGGKVDRHAAALLFRASRSEALG